MRCVPRRVHSANDETPDGDLVAVVDADMIEVDVLGG